MQNKLRYIITKFKEDEDLLNKLVVSAFIKTNSIVVEKNILIKSFLIENALIEGFPSFTFDDIIEAFELAIPEEEKVINGAVYTPTFIKEFIVKYSLSQLQKPFYQILASDISCGCGGFLFTLSQKIHSNTKKSYKEIFKENIYGLDISASSINRAEILLSLLALSEGEDESNFEFNLFVANALSFNWFEQNCRVQKNNGFDLIVGNPPYVRAKNIDKISKELLKNWKVTSSGNPDLYIAFFEVGIKYLNETGILGYITINSFFKSINARELRKHLQQNEYGIKIIDFGHEKIFIGKSAYTCICFITKEKSDFVFYKKGCGVDLFKSEDFISNSIAYKDLDYHKGWLLNDNNVIDAIKRIESTGKILGEKYKIRNGIATLSNDTYIFKPIEEDDKYYILSKDNKRYKIEKAICKDIIKPNILKDEIEIKNLLEKVIYPYNTVSNVLTLYEEEYFVNNFPNAYKYLTDYKEVLSQRDKGEGDYAAWYAFGRTQALSDRGYKLLFPYMAKSPHFIFTDNRDMLIYCGYAIFDESIEELKILKKILESKVFEFYIKNTSKPYSGDFYSYAKNYVKNFGICNLTDLEKAFISGALTKDEIDDFLIDKYGLLI